MTILQLEYFVAVVNHGSFSAAARYCCISQPTLSMQIQSLEKELGVVLLDRNTRPVVPTQAGLPLLEHARDTIESFRALKDRVNEHKKELSGKLQLGLVPSLSPYLLPRFIPEFTRRCPNVELVIRDVFPTDVADALNRGLVDVAILVSAERMPGISETKLFKDPVYVYVSPHNELYKNDVIFEHDLDFSKILVIHEGLWMREKRNRVIEARKKSYPSYSFMNTSIETLINMVDSAGAVTMISGMAIDYIPAEKRGRVKEFKDPDAYRTVAMAVGPTYVREKLVDAVRESFMAVAMQYALVDMMRK